MKYNKLLLNHGKDLEVNKIVLSANDDKRIRSINSIGTYTYGMSKDLDVKKKKLNVTI